MPAELGINGNSIQGQFVSATGPALSPVPPLPENWGVIKSAGVRTKVGSKKSKSRTGKLAISNPILNEDESGQDSLKKIHTIDLQEAANNDRLRREKYVQRIPNLIAQRPAPRPPSPTAVFEIMAGESRVVEGLERSESIKSNKSTSGLSVAGNASSTATQLSPGIDAVRRRSPRQLEPAAMAAPFRVIRPGEPIRIPIPRPSEENQDPPQAKPEPVKTPLQRRPTTGLPSNPRAQTLKSSTKETGDQKAQTVMFVNDIVYNNPDAVGDIIQGATKVPQPPDSGDSVVNRPRPIPRKGDKDRQVFPAEITPTHQHRRTKSSGSLISRKSILQSVPGSPTTLPSLPPLPQMAGMAARPAPNSTNSMTVEEKINLLYLTPLSAPPVSDRETRRRSSVPNLPPMPVVFQEERSRVPVGGLPRVEPNHGAQVSRFSKNTSARTSSLLGTTPAPRGIDQSNESVMVSNDRNPTEELGKSWLPGISLDTRSADEEVKRRSSPVLPRVGRSSLATSQDGSRSEDEETVTNWGSVYSPVAPVSRQNARSTYIGKAPRNTDSSEEIPIIILEESSERPGGGKPPLAADGEKPINSDIFQHLSGQFHHRLGDGCPTFSARKDKPRPRKMPPPTPLLLNGQTTKRGTIVQPSNPSPLESPGAAYEAIQAQLKKLDQYNQGQTRSPDRRLALLANLEQEMGQLEHEWQANHEHMGRDSMSSIKTSPSGNSRPTSIAVASSSRRSSVASAIAERRALRRARMQSGGGEEAQALSSRKTSQSPADIQAGPAGSRVSNTEKVPELPTKHKGPEPRPMTSGGLIGSNIVGRDEERHDGSGDSLMTLGFETEQSIATISKLWSVRQPVQDASKSGLWVPRIVYSEERTETYELLGLSVRPATRKHLSPLKIESSRLWQKDSGQVSATIQGGLWKSQNFQHPPVKTRPVTMRPPRKTKRVTLLPDIVENPEPLPNKRGTLGIFQFPWGERSENATIPYLSSQAFMAMPGTMTTGPAPVGYAMDPQGVQLEADEYSSSFFDEYDEEDGDNFSDFSGSGDDEFDETTLWEIASLLQTDGVPSRDSLLPMPLESPASMDDFVLAEYIPDMLSDDGREGSDLLDSFPLPEKQEISSTRPSLWEPQNPSQATPIVSGLPQHENLDWSEHNKYLIRRVKTRLLTDDLEIAPSTGLWSPMIKKTRSSNHSISLLWTASSHVDELHKTSSMLSIKTQDQAPGLWVKPEAISDSGTPNHISTLGLPEPEPQAWQELIARNKFINRPRSRPESPLATIDSSTLWSKHGTSNLSMLWRQPLPSPVTEDSGLFAPGASRSSYRTTKSLPAAISIPRRATRRNDASLEPLVSTTLWNLQMLAPVKRSLAGLWKPDYDNPNMTTPSPLAAYPVTNTLSSGLWNPPVHVKMSTAPGLFDLKATRRDFRRTSKLPIVIPASKSSRSARQDASALTSCQLWALECVRPVVGKDEKMGFLWQGELPVTTVMPTLFTLDASRKDYRTTSADPAALVMTRRLRTIQQPLQQLQSTQLWVSSSVVKTSVNWITMCASQSSTPLSPLTPLNSSPTISTSAEIASVETSPATASATTPSQDKGSFFRGWFGKKTNKGSADTVSPDAQIISPPLNNFGLPEGIVIKNLDEIPRTQPSHIPLTAMTTERTAYPQDWDVQLREAIVAGSDAVNTPRPQATPRDWSVALHQAVSESYPDVSTQHPVFLDTLTTAAETVHPALTSYDARAMQQQGLPASASASYNMPSLWSKPVDSETGATNGLWAPCSDVGSKFNSNLRRARESDFTSHRLARGNKAGHLSGPSARIDFGAQELWKRGNGSGQLRHPSAYRKNWLDDSTHKRFTRIELRY